MRGNRKKNKKSIALTQSFRIMSPSNASAFEQNDKIMKTTVSILSHLELAGFIKSNGTQCRFVSLLSDTLVAKIRKGNPYPGLRKVSRKTGLVNANYNTSVRNRIANAFGVKLSEVEYENGETWYQHLQTADGKALPLVEHRDKSKRGKLYLQFFPHKTVNAYQLPSGEVVPDENVKPWLYKESERSEFKPCVIVVELGNIKEMRASGVIMQAEDIDEAEAALATA
jgi:hypothetical protein